MKHAREIKVGLLATVCIFLLIFGFNFLKGVNIFSPTNSYHGTFAHLHGLEEQAAVSIRGHQVGHVDKIHYDYTRDSAFTVDISINKDIALPQGTKMAIVSDGLLGGVVIDLLLPHQSPTTNDERPIAHGSFLPTTFVPSLMESLQGQLIAKISSAVENIDSLVAVVNTQLEGNHVQSALTNIDRVSGNLSVVSSDLKKLMNNQVPRIVNNADTAVANLNTVIADIKAADLQATVARVDNAVDNVNGLVVDVRSENGTLGQLIYNKSLYNHIDATVVSADSLIVDLKAHPKRYVHFSLFGKKDK
ncbi:MAG: MCE family protein [Paludibacteraceae bacterium]|nr:MCE family protein [Paludibacteraceae bacterium]MBQ6984881.1 MCE family protein [Paludibacteraceae bacterium]